MQDKMYHLKELVSGFTTIGCTDRLGMLRVAHILNKSNSKERWTVCAV